MTAIEELRALPIEIIGAAWIKRQEAEAIVARQQAEIDDLRRQLAEVTRDLEQEWSCGAQVLQQEREAYNEMLAKLDLVTRERDELKKERATRLFRQA